MTEQAVHPYPPVSPDATGALDGHFDAPSRALDNLTAYFTNRYGRRDDGTCPVDEPFMATLSAAVDAANIIQDAVTVVASTDDFLCCEEATSTVMGVSPADYCRNAVERAPVSTAIVSASQSDFSDHGLNYLFAHDMSIVTMQSKHNIMVLALTVAGRYASCIHKSVYTADGGTGPGSRIYSPRQGAQAVIEQVQELEDRFKVVRSID